MLGIPTLAVYYWHRVQPIANPYDIWSDWSTDNRDVRTLIRWGIADYIVQLLSVESEHTRWRELVTLYRACEEA